MTQDNDQVGISYRRKPVRNNQNGASHSRFVQRGLDNFLRLRVQCAKTDTVTMQQFFFTTF